MVVEVVHRTALRYDRAIRETAMELRLQPADGAGQRLVE